MQLVASLSFFRHFISRALRLGVVVLALFTILLSSLAPSGVAYAVCPDDPADCESEVDSSGNPTSGSGKSPADSNTSSTTPTTSGSGYTASGVASTVAGVLGFSGDKTISLLITALAAIYSAIGRAIGYLIPITIDIIINVLNYNSFGDSFVVTIGWPIMRDLVNMSVIIILLMIAIRTMVGMGGGAQGAQQAIGRVFLAVVLVNFSKTITLLLVDASQIVMLTFVNALDVASGNFVELFQINAFLSTGWDVVANIDLQADTPNAVGFLVNSFLSTFLLAIVLMTLVILAIVFVYRIVVLWMLVVLSPVALFFYGLGDTLPGASGMVSEWRTKFVGALTIGPILAFFLWLSLAAASQGAAIAETEGFTFFENVAANSFLEIFQPAKLLSLGLGIMLLVIGMQLASTSASNLGKFSGDLVGKLPGWSAKLAKMSTLGAAKFGAGTAERRFGVGQAVGSGIGRVGANIQGGRGVVGGVLGSIGLAGTVGAAVAGVGGRVERFAETPVNEAKKASRERVSNYKGEQLAGAVLAITNGTSRSPLTPQNDRDDYATVEETLALNATKAAEAVSNLTGDGHANEAERVAAEQEARRQVSVVAQRFLNDEAAKNAYIDGDSKKRDEVREAEIRQAHLLDTNNRGTPARVARLQRLFSHPKFSASQIAAESLDDPDVVAALAQTSARPGQDGRPRSVLDDLRDGQKVSRAVQERARIAGRSAAAVPRRHTISEADLGVTPTTPTPDPGRVDVAADRVVRENMSVSGLGAAIAAPIVAALTRMRADRESAGDINGQARTMAALASGATGQAAVDHLGYDATGAFVSADVNQQNAASRAVNVIVNQRPADVSRLDTHVGRVSQLNTDVVDSISNNTINRFESDLRSAIAAGDVAAAQAIQNGLVTMQAALAPSIAALTPPATPADQDELDRLNELNRGFRRLQRFGPAP